MDVSVIYKIKNHEILEKYLRENSYWYKYLNRNKDYFKIFEEAMKKEYKLTPKDKVERFTKRIDMISRFMDAMR